jgi:hypothetical protein
VKRAFQDFVNKLEKTFRDEERAKKQELQRKVDDLSVFLKAAFEKLGVEGVLTPTCRWKDWVKRPEVTENTYYQQIELLVGSGDKDKDKGDNPERERGEKSDRAEKSDSITAGMANSSRNVFEDAVDAIKESYKQDRRLIKDVLDEKNYIIEHDSTYEAYSAVLLAAAGVRAGAAVDPVVEGEDKDKDDSAKTRPEKIEEKSDKKKDKDIQSLLWNMLDNRPKYPLLYFKEVHDDALAVYEQARERQKRKEDKFITLLEDFYNRSDHVGIQWEDAKQEIGKYPEYTNLARNDRKRIFTEYMTELEGIMKLKTKSLHDSMLGEVEKIRVEDKDETPLDETLKRSVEKDEKDRDRDTEGGEKRDSKRHRSDAERDRDDNRDREHRGRERGKEDDDRDKDRDRDHKGRDKDKHRSDREGDDRKRGRDRDRDDREDEEGEEDEDDEGDDEDGKKGKKHKKSKSSRDKAEKDKKHKKVHTDFNEAFPPF